MQNLVLATKLHPPSPRPHAVIRSRLVNQLARALDRRVTLVSAPPGFGKTTLVGSWVAGCGRPVAWLSLDDGDGDLSRFLTGLITTVSRVASGTGQGLLAMLSSPQTPPVEAVLGPLVQELVTCETPFVLVLDDGHAAATPPVIRALTFLVEHLPSPMHLAFITREDPDLPLARLRVRNQLTELRASDLRFTTAETEEFLNRTMGLGLSDAQVGALAARTEGWAAGLQLAALSLGGQTDIDAFLRSFSGSHRFVGDYLVEEVLAKQSEAIQEFLLRTSILDRLSGPLCDAVLDQPAGSGQAVLESLERANLFLVPLDTERRWYRYHHLFGELLRQRRGTAGEAHWHLRASRWYEENGMEREAFGHAAAAKDIDRAEQLMDSNGVPLYFRGSVGLVLDWLETLPRQTLQDRPRLAVKLASVRMLVGRNDRVEPLLRSTEASLSRTAQSAESRDLLGQIAGLRATLAVPRHAAEVIVAQSTRALELLAPANMEVRTMATWSLAYGHQLSGAFAAARDGFFQVLAASQASRNPLLCLAATTGLGNIAEAENNLGEAAARYRQALEWAGQPPLPYACEAVVGLGRVLFAQGDLAGAEANGHLAIQLSRQLPGTDTVSSCAILLSRVKRAKGDLADAELLLDEAERFVREHGFVHQLAKIAAARGVLVDELSAREREVLGLIAQGLSNEQIAAKLFVAETTVKGHNQKIFEKLQVKRRTAAVARARALGLI